MLHIGWPWQLRSEGVRRSRAFDPTAPHVLNVCFSLNLISYPQQVVWNLLHHRLDADLLSRGIERIAYVNADQCAESFTFTSSFSYICGDVYHSLDCVTVDLPFLNPNWFFERPFSLTKIYLTRSTLSRLGVFLLVGVFDD